MISQWVVLLDASHGKFAYGPFDDEALAEHFADYLTTEVDPAKVAPLKTPVGEMLAFWTSVLADRDEAGAAASRPEQWPPGPGDIWQDRNGDRWICTRIKPGDNSGYLTCIARQADDSAEEIWRLYGPMKRHTFIPPNVEEPPF